MATETVQQHSPRRRVWPCGRRASASPRSSRPPPCCGGRKGRRCSSTRWRPASPGASETNMTQDNKVPTRRLSAALILSLALLVGGLGILAAVVHFTMPRGGQTASSPSAIGGASISSTRAESRSREGSGRKAEPRLLRLHPLPGHLPDQAVRDHADARFARGRRRKVNVVFITVDPERDTTELLST